jgi:hypothetical protein
MRWVPTVKVLYCLILSRRPLALPGFQEILDISIMARAQKLHEYLNKRADRLDEVCEHCQTKGAPKTLSYEYYPSAGGLAMDRLSFCSKKRRRRI